MFVLLGRDPTASIVVNFWRALKTQMVAAGTSSSSVEKLQEADACISAMEAWARGKGKNVDAALATAEEMFEQKRAEVDASALVRVAGEDLLKRGLSSCGVMLEDHKHDAVLHVRPLVFNVPYLVDAPLEKKACDFCKRTDLPLTVTKYTDDDGKEQEQRSCSECDKVPF